MTDKHDDGFLRMDKGAATWTSNFQRPTMPLHLPKFTFLNGPAGSGKTTLAQLLFAQDTDICKLSFGDPIRMALTATFYEDYLYTPSGLDLTDGKVKASNIPGTIITHRRWMIEFGRFMHRLHGDSIFGHIAHRTCQERDVMYPRFLIDGLRTQGDIDPFIRNEGVGKLLLIQIFRDGANWPGDLGEYLFPPDIRIIQIRNSSEPRDMLRQLQSELERLPA